MAPSPETVPYTPPDVRARRGGNSMAPLPTLKHIATPRVFLDWARSASFGRKAATASTATAPTTLGRAGSPLLAAGAAVPSGAFDSTAAPPSPSPVARVHVRPPAAHRPSMRAQTDGAALCPWGQRL